MELRSLLQLSKFINSPLTPSEQRLKLLKRRVLLEENLLGRILDGVSCAEDLHAFNQAWDMLVNLYLSRAGKSEDVPPITQDQLEYAHVLERGKSPEPLLWRPIYIPKVTSGVNDRASLRKIDGRIPFDALLYANGTANFADQSGWAFVTEQPALNFGRFRTSAHIKEQLAAKNEVGTTLNTDLYLHGIAHLSGTDGARLHSNICLGSYSSFDSCDADIFTRSIGSEIELMKGRLEQQPGYNRVVVKSLAFIPE